MSGLHPRGPGEWLTMPQLPGETAKRAGIARGEERDAEADDERHVGFQFQRAAEEGVVGLVHVELDGTAFAALVDGSLNAGGVELLFVGRRKRMAVRMKLRVELGA